MDLEVTKGNVDNEMRERNEAGNAIILGAGFQVDNNAIFKAEIKTCYN